MILFIVLFFLSLFCLYLLAHDDLVLLRKNISVEQIFDIAFVMLIVGVLFSRFLYVILHFDPKFLNPFVFLLFPYYPGLSLLGGILGGSGYIAVFSKMRKMPMGRLFDFFSFAAFCATSFGLLGYHIFVKRPLTVYGIVISLIYLILFAVYVFLIMPKERRGELKDGSIGFLFLAVFAMFSFLLNIFASGSKVAFVFGIEEIILTLMFFISLILFLQQEKIIPKLSSFPHKAKENIINRSN